MPVMVHEAVITDSHASFYSFCKMHMLIAADFPFKPWDLYVQDLYPRQHPMSPTLNVISMVRTSSQGGWEAQIS